KLAHRWHDDARKAGAREKRCVCPAWKSLPGHHHSRLDISRRSQADRSRMFVSIGSSRLVSGMHIRFWPAHLYLSFVTAEWTSRKHSLLKGFSTAFIEAPEELLDLVLHENDLRIAHELAVDP